jgi:F0F1-type ATP synthase assembly protein I
MNAIVDLGDGLGAVLDLAVGPSGLGLLVFLLTCTGFAVYALLQQDSSNDDDDSNPGGGIMQPVYGAA